MLRGVAPKIYKTHVQMTIRVILRLACVSAQSFINKLTACPSWLSLIITRKNKLNNLKNKMQKFIESKYLILC